MLSTIVSAGGSKDWERSHQPQGGGAGWVGGPVQNQKTHTPQQTNEGVLWTTGELKAQNDCSYISSSLITYNYLGFTVIPHSAPPWVAHLTCLLFLYQKTCCTRIRLNSVVCRFLQGLSIRQIRFRFDGQPINETDTPAQVIQSSSVHLFKPHWNDVSTWR